MRTFFVVACLLLSEKAAADPPVGRYDRHGEATSKFYDLPSCGAEGRNIAVKTTESIHRVVMGPGWMDLGPGPRRLYARSPTSATIIFATSHDRAGVVWSATIEQDGRRFLLTMSRSLRQPNGQVCADVASMEVKLT